MTDWPTGTICAACQGDGIVFDDVEGEDVDCEACQGRGYVEARPVHEWREQPDA